MSIDQLFSILLFGISAVGVFESLSLKLMDGYNIGPGFLPLICSSILLFCSVCLFFSGKKQNKIHKTHKIHKIQWKDFLKKPLFNSLFFYVMTIVLYLMSGYLGMFCSLCIVSTIILFQQDQMKKWQVLVFEVIFMVSIYLVFSVLLKIPFEHGILFANI